MPTDVFDDLEAEQRALDAVLGGLPEATWLSPSGASGWTVADVVLHLAQTEEMVVLAARTRQAPDWREHGDDVDSAMEALVRADSGTPAQILERWRAACRASVAALRQSDPRVRVQWVASTLKPATLATTRLAEHWAHALDIVDPLGVDYPDTVRLRHIAWLGHGTLPYAFGLTGREPADVFCDLTAPDGTSWQFGPRDAASAIEGSASAFCRVGAHRLAPDESGLTTRGPHGRAALHALRNYAHT